MAMSLSFKIAYIFVYNILNSVKGKNVKEYAVSHEEGKATCWMKLSNKEEVEFSVNLITNLGRIKNGIAVVKYVEHLLNDHFKNQRKFSEKVMKKYYNDIIQL